MKNPYLRQQERRAMLIELFEPAMCCSSGVCGPAVDPKMIKLQETLRRIEEQGNGEIKVRRFNLSNDLEAFADNASINEVLREQGPGGLPVVYIDGILLAQRDYPTMDEWQEALLRRGFAVDLSGAAAAGVPDLPGGSGGSGDGR